MGSGFGAARGWWDLAVAGPLAHPDLVDLASINSIVLVKKADGSTEAKTLTQLGITEITLKTDATLITFADGSQITGQTTFTMGGVARRNVS